MLYVGVGEIAGCAADSRIGRSPAGTGKDHRPSRDAPGDTDLLESSCLIAANFARV